MDIQNSLDFSSVKLKPLKPTDNNNKHGELVLCLSIELQSLRLFGIIKHLMIGYSGDSKFIVALNTNYCPHNSQQVNNIK